MTNPIPANEAMVPRCQPRFPDPEPVKQEDNEEQVVIGYAPPGASMRAKVRRLKDDECTHPVTPAEGDVAPKGAVTVKAKNDTEVVIKVETEVALKGEIPSQGLVIETVTHVRPQKHAERNKDYGD